MTKLEALYKKLTGEKEEQDSAIRLVQQIQNTFLGSVDGQKTLGYLLAELGYFRSDCDKKDTGKRNVAAELMKILAGFNVEVHLATMLDGMQKLRIKQN